MPFIQEPLYFLPAYKYISGTTMGEYIKVIEITSSLTAGKTYRYPCD
jgi:hypothetical protein